MNLKKIMKTKKFWILVGAAITGLGLVLVGQSDEGMNILNGVIQSAIEMFNM